jgi:hypothetical protein
MNPEDDGMILAFSQSIDIEYVSLVSSLDVPPAERRLSTVARTVPILS